MRKLNLDKNLIYFVCYKFNYFDNMKYLKFLWFDIIRMRFFIKILTNFGCYFSKTRIIIINFLL